MSLDMNEPSEQGIPISKLLEIIGKQSVEWAVEQESLVKVKERMDALLKELSTTKAELAALKSASPVISPELEQLRKVDVAKDTEIKMLENQVHATALERDDAKKKVDELQGQLLKSRDDYTTLQYQCDDMQKEIDSLKVIKKKK